MSRFEVFVLSSFITFYPTSPDFQPKHKQFVHSRRHAVSAGQRPYGWRRFGWSFQQKANQRHSFGWKSLILLWRTRCFMFESTPKLLFCKRKETHSAIDLLRYHGNRNSMYLDVKKWTYSIDFYLAREPCQLLVAKLEQVSNDRPMMIMDIFAQWLDWFQGAGRRKRVLRKNGSVLSLSCCHSRSVCSVADLSTVVMTSMSTASIRFSLFFYRKIQWPVALWRKTSL